MKKLLLKAFVLAGGFIFFTGAGTSVVEAQSTHPILEASRIPPRVEDHFWRRRVLNRIDLEEKINEPLWKPEVQELYDNPPYGEVQGVVRALLKGLKSGKYLAYDPDSLNKALTWEDIVKKAQEIEGTDGGDEWDTGESEFDEFGGDADDGFGTDEFDDLGDLEGDTDPFGGGGDDPFAGGGSSSSGEFPFEVAPYETVLEFIEDRIFDKNRSDMVYDIKFIRLMWVDPVLTLPDKKFVCFRYGDVLETLEDTQWKNKYNDAEYRNMREIFEMRLFNSIILNVSGRGVGSLEESDFRRNQLVEFEHHLWSY